MLNAEQAAIVKGMLARGDAQHSIAAHFGENAARVAEIKAGDKFPNILPAPISTLPPLKTSRFIDPKAPAEAQYKQLMAFITQPPQGSRVTTITAELAALILERLNDNNRRKRSANIRKFADAMGLGWILTGDTVKFSKSGVLLDGQNRLAACVRAGVPFETHVVYGIADDAFTRIDANARRTNPDTLQIAGASYSQIAAPAVRWLMIYDSFNPKTDGVPDRSRRIDNQELLEYWRSRVDKDLMDFCATKAKGAGKHLPHGQLAAHFYLFLLRNKKAAEQFINEVIGCKRGGAKLIKKVADLRKQQAGRIHELQINALIIQAWNLHKAGKPITSSALNWNENREYPAIG